MTKSSSKDKKTDISDIIIKCSCGRDMIIRESISDNKSGIHSLSLKFTLNCSKCGRWYESNLSNYLE